MEDLLVSYFRQYYSATQLMQQALSEAQEQAKKVEIPSAEQLEAQIATIDIGRALSRLRASHEVFMARFNALNPPSKDVVDQTIALATDLAKNIAANKQASALLKSVTAFIDAWTAIIQPPAPASAPASAPGPAMAAAAMPSSEASMTTWHWLKMDAQVTP
jgi:hypothetical protein